MFDYAIGQSASLTRAFSVAEVVEFSAAFGDGEPARTHVPAGLIGGLISTLLGTRLPGRGTNWMKQMLCFAAAARIGEPLTATVEIVRLRPDKKLVNLRTICVNAAGDLVCDGEALVLALEMAPAAIPAAARR
jgi:3-hydroxybutyryl-CoA dehydratase